MINHWEIKDYSDLVADHGLIQVPMVLMERIHDPGYVHGISQSEEDKAIIDFLIEDIPENGVLFPGLLELHLNGYLTLQDGNHRFFALRELGWEFYPANLHEVKWSPSKRGIYLSEIAEEFAEVLEQNNVRLSI